MPDRARKLPPPTPRVAASRPHPCAPHPKARIDPTADEALARVLRFPARKSERPERLATVIPFRRPEPAA